MASLIDFSGYTWQVAQTGEVPVNPGPNLFSAENVWVDTQGYLHLKITQRNNRWYCTGVTLTEPLGLGTYEFFVISRFDQLDPNVVAGLFLYQDDEHELDIEFTRWKNVNGKNLHYTVQPGKKAGHAAHFQASLSGTYTAHRIRWRRENVSFRSIHSHNPQNWYQPPYPLANWTFTKADSLPDPARTRLNINFWLIEGKPPQIHRSVEIIISKVIFYP